MPVRIGRSDSRFLARSAGRSFRMASWSKSNWFLLALAAVFLVGHFAAPWLEFLNEAAAGRSIVVMLVMWAMGVTLHPEAIRGSLRRPAASLLAIGINVLLVPLLCLPARWGFSPSVGGGIFVAGLVPCTLASASVWTRKAGGDDSISMMTTVVTNLACVVVVPVGIFLVLAKQAEISAVGQMEKLAWFVVLPLVAAQVMRRVGLAGWADRHKTSLSTWAQVGILVMVLFGAVAGASYRPQSPGLSWWATLGVVAVTATIHLVALAVGIAIARRIGLSRPSQIAVGIAGSQKTLMVGLQIAIDCGVSVLPMLIYHAVQLALDTVIVQRWKADESPAE